MNLKRNSYASIELKKHILTNDYQFDFLDSNVTATDEDEEIVNDLLNEIEEYEIHDFKGGTGEWLWLQNNKQKDFIHTITNKKVKQLSLKLATMFKNDSTYGYLSPSFYDVNNDPEMVKSDILHNIDSCVEFAGLKNITDLLTPATIGAPFGLLTDGGVVLPDTPRHYYYAMNIKRKLNIKVRNPLVVEIGGGYGGLCKILKEQIKNCAVINIDLLPALCTAYYYMKKLKIEVSFIQGIKDWKPNKINLLCADQFDAEQGYNLSPNLIFNSRSLCEMAEETCNKYLKFVNKSSTNYFYHENSNYLLFPNSIRHVELLADDFGIDENKYNLQWKCITPFTGGKGRYREYMYAIES